jgi:hypothetical protein
VILSEAYDDCVADIGNLLPSCIFKSLALFFLKNTSIDIEKPMENPMVPDV